MDKQGEQERKGTKTQRQVVLQEKREIWLGEWWAGHSLKLFKQRGEFSTQYLLSPINVFQEKAQD